MPVAALLAALLLLLAGAGAPAGAAALEARLAAADPARGERVFRKCAACHSAEPEGRRRVGPGLWGVVDGPVAAREGFRYSKAMRAFGGRWTPERLDAYLARPRAVVRGGSMQFAGLKRERDRADLIAWLALKSDAPRRFGPGPAAAPAAESDAAAEADDLGLMVAGAGALETHGACTPCHSERIVIQQGLTRAQWDETLDWMVEEHDMDEIVGRQRAIILDYLARHYGPDRPNFPRR